MNSEHFAFQKQQQFCLSLTECSNNVQHAVQSIDYEHNLTNENSNHYLLIPISYLALDVSALSKIMLAQFVELISNCNSISLNYDALEKLFNVKKRSVQRSLKELKELNLISVTEYRFNRVKHFSIKVNFETIEGARLKAMQKHSFFTPTNLNQCLSVPKFAIAQTERADTLLAAAFLTVFDKYYMRTEKFKKIVGVGDHIARRVLNMARKTKVMCRSGLHKRNVEVFNIDHCLIKRKAFFDALVSDKNVSSDLKRARRQSISARAQNTVQTTLDKTMQSECKASLNKALHRTSYAQHVNDSLNSDKELKRVRPIDTNKTHTYKNRSNYACAKRLDSYELTEISDAVKASTEKIHHNEALQDDAVVTMQTLAQAFAVNPVYEQIVHVLHDNPTIEDSHYQSRYHRALMNVIAGSYSDSLEPMLFTQALAYIQHASKLVDSHSSWANYQKLALMLETNTELDYSLKVTAKELRQAVQEHSIPQFFTILLTAENNDRPRLAGYELNEYTIHKFLNHYADCSNAPKSLEQFGRAFENWCRKENGKMVAPC